MLNYQMNDYNINMVALAVDSFFVLTHFSSSSNPPVLHQPPPHLRPPAGARHPGSRGGEAGKAGSDDVPVSRRLVGSVRL